MSPPFTIDPNPGARVLFVFLALIVIAVLVARGAFGDQWRGIAIRILAPALILGGIGFALGFFGPLIVAPQANQGPLLGIFITGPCGFVIGLAFGVVREMLRGRATTSRP
jgi:hypothetical protein